VSSVGGGSREARGLSGGEAGARQMAQWGVLVGHFVFFGFCLAPSGKQATETRCGQKFRQRFGKKLPSNIRLPKTHKNATIVVGFQTDEGFFFPNPAIGVMPRTRAVIK
jgi:hypothetical protein